MGWWSSIVIGPRTTTNAIGDAHSFVSYKIGVFPDLDCLVEVVCRGRGGEGECVDLEAVVQRGSGKSAFGEAVCAYV